MKSIAEWRERRRRELEEEYEDESDEEEDEEDFDELNEEEPAKPAEIGEEGDETDDEEGNSQWRALNKVRRQRQSLSPAVEDDTEILDWNDKLQHEDFEELDRIVRTLNPGFVPAAELIPEAALRDEVKAKRNPKSQFNALLSFGEGARAARGFGPQGAGSLFPGKNVRYRPIHAPNMVLVSGHKQYTCGNVGLNGLYERYPEDFHGRPVYQKMFERRYVTDEEFHVEEEGITLRRAWEPRDATARLIERRHQTATPLTPEPDVPVHPRLHPAKDEWFLFFDDRRGSWCIGPAVGATEVYAKCPAVEDEVPSLLRRWLVWDAGQKVWYENQGMKVVKAGK